MNSFKRIFLLLLTILSPLFWRGVGGEAVAQTQTFPANGAINNVHSYYAFKNCTLHVDESTILNNAVLVIKDGLIVDAGEKANIPANAVVYDLKGKHIYPSFIEMYSDYGMPE